MKCLIGMCLLCLGQPIWATETPIEKLEIISVTASKLSLGVAKTPDSLTVLLNQDIKQVAPQHINQITAQAPGAWISRGNGQEHLSAIRSPVLTGAGSCGAFFMGLDGISLRGPGFCNANQLFDINYEQAASLDVLRSSASTLYGANALHGVINVISQDAFYASPNALSLELGAYDFARLSGVYSKQTSNSAILALANVTQENGYQTQSGYDQQKLTTIYQARGPVWNNKTLVDISNLNQETAGFIEGTDSYKNSTIRKINPNPEAFRDAKSLRAYSAFSRATGLGELNLTPYLRANSMAFLQHFLPWQALEENAHNSLGLQSNLRFKHADISWIIGADIDYTHGRLKETQADDFTPNIPAGVHYNYEVKASQSAIYAQGLWQNDTWQLRLGARAAHTTYDYKNHALGVSACDDTVAVCRFTRPLDQTLTFSAISPSANLSYQFNSDTMWYFKYAQGFRPPQTTELFRLQNNQQITDINNENMDTWETGLRWANQHSGLHFATFLMHKRDVIFQNSNRQNVTGGKTDHHGFEIEASHRFNDNWSLKGHISYAKHSYANNTSLVISAIKGNIIDTAPKWMSQVNLNYQASDTLRAQLSWQYLSEYYLNPENTAKYDGHQLIDLHLRYQVSEKVTLSAHMLNLLDTDYAERADFAFGNYRYFVGQPRRAFINFQWFY